MIHHRVNITSVINGGFGLGKLSDGRKVMVRHVLAGEEIDVSVSREKKSYLIGETENIITASPHRVSAPCEYYPTCGGCDLQHASYEHQLAIKQHIIVDLLARNPHLPPIPRSQVKECLPSPDEFNYRQRIRLHIHSGKIGFHKYRSSDVIQISHCPLAHRQINLALSELLEHKDFKDISSNADSLELLWNPVSNRVTLLFFLQRKPRPNDLNAAVRLEKSSELIERIFYKGDTFQLTPAAPADCDGLLGVSYNAPAISPGLFNWEVGAFCQVNLEQNTNLIKLVRSLANPSSEDEILDLFCGMGNFSIPLGLISRSVYGMEGQGAAIRCARLNSLHAGLENTTFKKIPIHLGCIELLNSMNVFDTIIVDPPRQGIPGLAESLGQLCKRKLIYISCDPATLVRDLGELCRENFSIRSIQPVDMFPQTHHIETVVLLEKN